MNTPEDFGIEETISPSKGWWCCLIAFLILAFGSFSVLIGYILFA